MKSEKPNGRSPRDAALARLLADALDSKAAADAQSAACPDAEVLAAYADHGLPVQEASRWEGHIADCGRCQKIIAGIVVSGENLGDADVQKQGSLAAAPVIRKPAPQRGAGILQGPKLWHWWMPGLGLAAAVALWFVLHPALSPSPASRAVATAETARSAAQANPATSSAKPEETQMAQANVPPPPASVSGSLRDSEEQRVNSAADALKKAAPKQEALQNERRALAESPAVSDVTRADAAPEAKEKDEAAASAQQADTKTRIEARAGTPAAPAAAAPPPRAESGSGAGQTQSPARQLDGSARFSGTNQVRALAKALSAPITFGSPDRSVLWRVGPGGLIENSSDQGKTWRQQASGVAADLLAGAAPSAKIAWAVGAGGTILRTEDGERWQRVTPPALAQNATAPDWTAIDARDELNATVVSRDLHRYATADGGRTWVQQQ